MSFEAPELLPALLLVPLALIAYAIVQRRRRRYAVRFTNLDLLASVASGSPRWRRHVPPALALLALGALALALARPHFNVDVPRQRATVMLTTDVSGSMQAPDVQPDRLSAARSAAKKFSDDLPDQFRLGLVTFNQSAQLAVPATTDHDHVQQALDGLQAQGGTAMGDALDTSLNVLRDLAQQDRRERGRRGAKSPAVIVLLSDGKSTDGHTEPLDAAEKARRMGIPVNTVALGTDEGTVELTGPSGELQSIDVPPDRETLRTIAERSGGRYFDAPDAGRLDAIYDRLGSKIGYKTERRDYTAAFVGAGLGLMAVGGAFSLFWFGRLP